jgi:hypothetical protein
MNWSALGATGEFLGAVAVVGSLVYLAMQIKQARQMFATGAQQQIGDAIQQILRDIWSNPEVHRIWYVATTKPEKLEEMEQERFGMLLYSMFVEFSNVLEISKIEPQILENYGPVIDRMLKFPAVFAWWQRQSTAFPHGSMMTRHVESRISALGLGKVKK